MTDKTFFGMAGVGGGLVSVAAACIALLKELPIAHAIELGIICGIGGFFFFILILALGVSV